MKETHLGWHLSVLKVGTGYWTCRAEKKGASFSKAAESEEDALRLMKNYLDEFETVNVPTPRKINTGKET